MKHSPSSTVDCSAAALRTIQLRFGVRLNSGEPGLLHDSIPLAPTMSGNTTCSTTFMVLNAQVGCQDGVFLVTTIGTGRVSTTSFKDSSRYLGPGSAHRKSLKLREKLQPRLPCFSCRKVVGQSLRPNMNMEPIDSGTRIRRGYTNSSERRKNGGIKS